MEWTWDDEKDWQNRRKHGFSFETAIQVFSDDWVTTTEDPYLCEQRFRTIGMVGGVNLMVIHTAPEYDPEFGAEVGRIISARRATRSERQTYEESEYHID